MRSRTAVLPPRRPPGARRRQHLGHAPLGVRHDRPVGHLQVQRRAWCDLPPPPKRYERCHDRRDARDRTRDADRAGSSRRPAGRSRRASCSRSRWSGSRRWRSRPCCRWSSATSATSRSTAGSSARTCSRRSSGRSSPGGRPTGAGPAPPFAAGCTLFAIGLIAGGLAPTMPLLVLARVVQGLGAGTVPAVAYAVDRSSLSRRGAGPGCSRCCRPPGWCPRSPGPRSRASSPTRSAGAGCSSASSRSSRVAAAMAIPPMLRIGPVR